MGPVSTLVPRAVACGLVAAFASIGQAMAQDTGCGLLPQDLEAAHTGETPVFSGNDDNNRTFTVTQDKKTGAWALWVINEFKKDAGGLEIGKPCIVTAGRESKLLGTDIPPPAAPAAEVASENAAVETPPPPTEPKIATAPAADADTYRVTGIDAGKVLDLRAGPGTDFPTIVPIPSDAKGVGVEVASCKKVKGYRHQWCEASWSGQKGWASACCLASEKTGRKLD